MMPHGRLQIILLGLMVIAPPVGLYLHHVFRSLRKPLPKASPALERVIHRVFGSHPREGEAWMEYSVAFLCFGIGLVLTCCLVSVLIHPVRP